MKAAPFTPDQRDTVNRLLAEGVRVHQVARELGMSYETFRLCLALSRLRVGRILMDKEDGDDGRERDSDSVCEGADEGEEGGAGHLFVFGPELKTLAISDGLVATTTI